LQTRNSTTYVYLPLATCYNIDFSLDSECRSQNQDGCHFSQGNHQTVLVSHIFICTPGIDTDSCRADGVYMGFPFIAYCGAVKNDGTLLQIAYDQCRLYRDALLIDGPTGKLWAHIYDDDNSTWIDKGIWATGIMLDFAPLHALSLSTKQVMDGQLWACFVLQLLFKRRHSMPA